LDLLLTEQQNLFAETARRLCLDHGGPRRLRALRAAGEEIDRDAWRAALDAEWLATVVAEDRGGQGLGAFDLALALEQAGRQLLLVPLDEAAAAAWTMSRASDTSRASGALADVLGGSGLIVPATEAASWRPGGHASGIRYDHKAGVLDGSIPFVAYGGSADAFLVAIDSGAQPVLAVVPRSNVSVVTESNVDGSSSSRLTLAAAALDVTLDYVKLRQQFGKPIGSFQVLQHRAVNGFIDVELNRSLTYRVLAAYDAGEHHPAMVSAAKARAARGALEITRAALQMHGAIGYTEEHDIGLYYKRAMTLAAQYGGELGHTSRFSALTLEGTGAAP
jgi:alkylation response protein AidB-like acyl-CoA dehydrogenase